MALSRVYGLIFVFVYSLVFYFVNSSCHEMINLNAAIYIKTNCAPNICTRILDDFVKMLDLNLTNMAVLVNLIFHTSGHNWWPKFEFCMGSFFFKCLLLVWRSLHKFACFDNFVCNMRAEYRLLWACCYLWKDELTKLLDTVILEDLITPEVWNKFRGKF